MKKYDSKKNDHLSEVFLSDSLGSASASRMVKAGTARKIGPRLYIHNMLDAPEAVVARSLWPIVALLMPGAVVSHRLGPRRLQDALPLADVRHPNGWCRPTLLDLADVMDVSQAKATYPLERLTRTQ